MQVSIKLNRVEFSNLNKGVVMVKSLMFWFFYANVTKKESFVTLFTSFDQFGYY